MHHKDLQSSGVNTSISHHGAGNPNNNNVKLKSYTNEELERLIQLKNQSLEHLQALNLYPTPTANTSNTSSTNNINSMSHTSNHNLNNNGGINSSRNNVSFGLTPHGLKNRRDLPSPEKIETNLELLINSNALNNVSFNNSFQQSGSKAENMHYINPGGIKGNSPLKSYSQPKVQQNPYLQNLASINDFQTNKTDIAGMNNTSMAHSVSISDSKLDIPQIRNSIEGIVTNRFSNKENFNLSMTPNFANNTSTASNLIPPSASGLNSKARGDSSGN